ncbi:MAG: hypothetical protein R3175_07295 [Marinobacter sp.]|uniref:hypothetical protein n=1 Tax=Marinobacter sp. TaxID=50741 RepID=UPI00299F028C|nr:hypothetical protein [Marinobacter sp.]MDX1755846.1 hypothetical protein [Marinobacter sp.]
MKHALLPLLIATVAGTGPASAAFDDAGTDYSKQHTDSWTWTPGLEPMETPNEILCFMQNLKAGEMVNQGPYTALVNMADCTSGQQDQNNNRGPDNITAIVESTRASNSDPQLVKVWIPRMNEGFMTTQIRAMAVIRQSPSAANPAGDFTLTFQMYDADNIGLGPLGQGQLQSVPTDNGNTSLTFYESFGMDGFSDSRAATIEKNGAAGAAITQSDSSFDGLRRYQLSWNDSRALVEQPNSDGSGTAQACLAKDVLEERVYGYGVYHHSDGSELEIQGGFPFEFESGNQRVHGYLGYWGLWMEDQSLFQDGMTVNKMDFSGGAPSSTPVILHSSGGRLNKITTDTRTLAEISGVRFGYWEGGTNYRAEYLANGGDGEGFYKVAEEAFSEDGPPQVTELEPPQLIDTTGLNRLDLYSDQLGGSVTVRIDSGGGLKNEVVLRKRQVVSSSDLTDDLTLYCSWGCPGSTLNETTLGPNGDPMLDTSGGNAQYTFDAQTMALTHNGNPVTWPDALSADSVSPQWAYGIHSGVLTTTEAAQETFNTGGELSTWYEWETGPQSWNRSFWATGNGQVISIEPPVFLSLTFTAEDDRDGFGTDYYNEPFLLEYSGLGELHGLPFEADEHMRYAPAINLRDGTLLTAANGGEQFVVKALHTELSLVEQDASACGSLSLTEPSTPLPTSIDSDAPLNTDPVPSPVPSPAAVVNGDVVSQD